MAGLPVPPGLCAPVPPVPVSPFEVRLLAVPALEGGPTGLMPMDLDSFGADAELLTLALAEEREPVPPGVLIVDNPVPVIRVAGSELPPVPTELFCKRVKLTTELPTPYVLDAIIVRKVARDEFAYPGAQDPGAQDACPNKNGTKCTSRSFQWK